MNDQKETGLISLAQKQSKLIWFNFIYLLVLAIICKVIIFKKRLNKHNKQLEPSRSFPLSLMSNKITKTPITYSFFYHLTGFKKDQTNECVKLFMDHVKKTTHIIPKNIINEISVLIVQKITDERTKRELIQAINLELSIEGVQDLFKNLINSKEISKEEIEQILDKANNKF